MTKKAITAKIMLGIMITPEANWFAAELAMLVRFVPPKLRDTTKMVRKSAGSTIAEIIISLLAPRPPNALATSIPANIVKNLTNANSPMTTSISPAALNGLKGRKDGTKRAAVIVEISIIQGAERKIHEL
jgi:hypothetical protein